MSLLLPIPVNYGWVILTGLASIVTAMGLGIRVDRARKAHDVSLPKMYDDNKGIFNCVQRGHQNMLESHYANLWAMSIAGLEFPLTAAVLGGIWTLGRVGYAVGYSSGEPRNRYIGTLLIAPGHLGLLGLAGYVALMVLGYVKSRK